MPTSMPLEAWPEHTPRVLQVWSPHFLVIQEKPRLETQDPSVALLLYQQNHVFFLVYFLAAAMQF